MSSTGSVMLSCRYPNCLRSLHHEVTLNANRFREGRTAQVWKNSFPEFTPQQARLLEQVGFPYGLELWKPHFTVAKIDPSRIDRIQPLLDGFEGIFTGRKVGLGSSGEHGVVTELLYDFKLGAR